MKASIVAKRLQKQFPRIEGIHSEVSENGNEYIHLGNAAEGGLIDDKELIAQCKKDSELATIIGSDFGLPAADYYGEFKGGYPYINPELEEAVSKYGYAIEWYDGGTLQAFQK